MTTEIMQSMNITHEEINNLQERIRLEMQANVELSKKYTRLLELCFMAVISCRLKGFETDEIIDLADAIEIDIPYSQERTNE